MIRKRVTAGGGGGEDPSEPARRGFNSQVMRLLVLNIKCSSNNHRIQKAYLCSSVSCGCIVSANTEATVHTAVHGVHGARALTGAPLFKVSPWALSSDREADEVSAPLPTAKILPELPWGGGEGNVIWKRGKHRAQQQLFPNHNNLGKGCG